MRSFGPSGRALSEQLPIRHSLRVLDPSMGLRSDCCGASTSERGLVFAPEKPTMLPRLQGRPYS